MDSELFDHLSPKMGEGVTQHLALPTDIDRSWHFLPGHGGKQREALGSSEQWWMAVPTQPPGQNNCDLFVKFPDCYMGKKEKRIFKLPLRLHGFVLFGFYLFFLHEGSSFILGSHTEWSFT